MRIAHVTQSPVRGGLMKVVESLAAAQAAAHDVTVAAVLDPPAAGPPPGVSWLRHSIGGNSHVGRQRRLAAGLRERGCDAVVLHAGSPGECAYPAFLLSSGPPCVVVEHLPEFFPMARPVRDRALFTVKRRAAAWVSVSGAGARALEERAGLPRGAIGVVHNGVAEPGDVPPPSDERALFDGRRVVLASGRPDERKGWDVFREVAGTLAARAPDARFVWVGGDAARTDGAVCVLPWSAHLGWMTRAAEVVLVPSRAEGLPLVLLEAWACGTAVVASAVGGIPEVVRAGEDALLAPAGDAAAWTDAVVHVLGDAGAAARLGAAGRARWQEEFTVEAMAARYDELLARAIPAA